MSFTHSRRLARQRFPSRLFRALLSLLGLLALWISFGIIIVVGHLSLLVMFIARVARKSANHLSSQIGVLEVETIAVEIVELWRIVVVE